MWISSAVVLLWMAAPAPGGGDAWPTPAQHKVSRARAALDKAPTDAAAYTRLAMAMTQRARETADPAHYVQALEVLGKALELRPDDFEARKVQVWAYLGLHEFAKALDLAKALNGRAPDDVMVYGLITDACVELGRYAEAEQAAQWMLDLRPGNAAGLTRAAYLRELWGDLDGAIELMEKAYRQLDLDEVEERAWILTQLAHLRLAEGKVAVAEPLLREALALFPDYHYALQGLAQVRSAQGRHPEAADLLRRRYDIAPHPENAYAVAEALRRAGRNEEANTAYHEFEGKARLETDAADNANHELVFYYADRAGKPAEALRVASLERSRRADVHSRHAYAWALHVNGRHREARQEIEAVLAVGIRDARILFHAGRIAEAAKDRAAARRYFQRSLAQSAVSEVAAAARDRLRSL